MPRPWLSREAGECAFPVAGEGRALIACCNPCGADGYCPGHARRMRISRSAVGRDFETDTLRWLDERG